MVLIFRFYVYNVVLIVILLVFYSGIILLNFVYVVRNFFRVD